MNAIAQPRLLAISGSIRKESTNTAILHALQREVADVATLTIFPLNEIPAYNSDLEASLPDSVRQFKEAISGSSGLIICSPEYNHGMSGVLKNALDWASRPGFASPLKNKPALIMSSSPGATGGARAHHQVRETLSAALSRVVSRAQVAVALVNQKMEGGRFVDTASITFMREAVADLLWEITLVDGAPTR